jgi:hypothetical protein
MRAKGWAEIHRHLEKGWLLNQGHFPYFGSIFFIKKKYGKCPLEFLTGFTPLEKSAIYGGGNINKASFSCRKGRVKAPPFLTG